MLRLHTTYILLSKFCAYYIAKVVFTCHIYGIWQTAQMNHIMFTGLTAWLHTALKIYETFNTAYFLKCAIKLLQTVQFCTVATYKLFFKGLPLNI